MIFTAAAATVGAISTVVDIANKAEKVISKGAATANTIASLTNNNSLVEFTQGARVEPLTIIGADCINVDFMPDVMQSLQTLFSGYYLQAVAMTTQINGVSVLSRLDKLNPNRNSLLTQTILGVPGKVAKWNSSNESIVDWRSHTSAYRFRLPTTKNSNAVAFERHSIATESSSNNSQADYYYNKDRREDDAQVEKDKRNVIDDERKRKQEEDRLADRTERAREQAEKKILDDAKTEDAIVEKVRKHEEEKEKKELADAQYEDAMVEKLRKHEEDEAEKKRNKSIPVTTTITDKSISAVRELADLSVGKMIGVTFGGGKDSAGNDIRPTTIPISIRLMVNTMAESSLINLLCSGSMDNSLSERYHAWRSGRIGFVRDLVFCQDLIDEHKKAMIKDHTGIHNEIIRRVNNAKIAGLITKDPSLNVASNLYVISEVTAATIESKLGGKLSNINVRNKIFDSGYAMIIAVVDRRYEVITFYHRGISASTTVTARDLKISNKSNGPDVSDILKAYVVGNAPSL